MRMLLTRAGAKTHEEEHPPVDLFSSAMALGRRIVAMAASYAAKGFGIKTGTAVGAPPDRLHDVGVRQRLECYRSQKDAGR